MSKIVQSCSVTQGDEVPQECDGNLLFKLPPSAIGMPMAGMEQKYDGHCWVKPVLTRMKLPAYIKRSKCGGHLMFKNESCPRHATHGTPNQTIWSGNLMQVISSNGMSSLPFGSLSCFYCGEAPILLKDYPCFVYYVLIDDNRSRLFIHQGTHKHPIARGVLWSAIQKTHHLVSQLIAKVPTIGPRNLRLNIAKQMVMGDVMREDGEEIHSNELTSILEEMRGTEAGDVS